MKITKTVTLTLLFDLEVSNLVCEICVIDIIRTCSDFGILQNSKELHKMTSTYDVILSYLRKCDVKTEGTLPKGIEETNNMALVSCLYLN